MKKLITIGILLVAVLVFSGCTKNETPNDSSQGKVSENTVVEDTSNDDGFVRLPGEPSRETSDYYIVEDLCAQFTKEFIENKLGKDVVKAKSSTISSVYSCSYYTSDKDYVMLNLNYLSATNQKEGQEALDRRVEEDANIPMKNMVVYQEDGNINSIYLVLSDNKFISIQRSSIKALTNEEDLKFAKGVAETIKNFK